MRGSDRGGECSDLDGVGRAGDTWEDSGLVFTTPTGTPIDARNLIRRVKHLLNEAGLPEIRFHDLRHTGESLLLAQGMPTRVVMEVLGHSPMALTTDTYQHVMPELKTEAAEQMDEALRFSDTA